MILLAARLTFTTPARAIASIASSSKADSHHLSSLLTIVVEPIGAIMKALIVMLSPDMSWIVDFRAFKHMTPYLHNVQNLQVYVWER
jgi:hypothetical protein